MLQVFPLCFVFQYYRVLVDLDVSIPGIEVEVEVWIDHGLTVLHSSFEVQVSFPDGIYVNAIVLLQLLFDDEKLGD